MIDRDIPYGHRLMISLGYLECSIALIAYPIILIGLAYSEEFVEISQINIIIFFIVQPFMIFFGFDALNKLRRKDIQGLKNVKTLMIITLTFTAIGLIESIYTKDFESSFLILCGLPFTIFTLIYWGAPSHKSYFESFLKL